MGGQPSKISQGSSNPYEAKSLEVIEENREIEELYNKLIKNNENKALLDHWLKIFGILFEYLEENADIRIKIINNISPNDFDNEDYQKLFKYFSDYLLEHYYKNREDSGQNLSISFIKDKVDYHENGNFYICYKKDKETIEYIENEAREKYIKQSNHDDSQNPFDLDKKPIEISNVYRSLQLSLTLAGNNFTILNKINKNIDLTKSELGFITQITNGDPSLDGEIDFSLESNYTKPDNQLREKIKILKSEINKENDDLRDIKDFLQPKRYSGIGAKAEHKLVKKEGRNFIELKVIEVFQNSPAERMGLKNGYSISIDINNDNFKHLNPEENLQKDDKRKLYLHAYNQILRISIAKIRSGDIYNDMFSIKSNNMDISKIKETSIFEQKEERYDFVDFESFYQESKNSCIREGKPAIKKLSDEDLKRPRANSSSSSSSTEDKTPTTSAQKARLGQSNNPPQFYQK